MGIFDFFRRKPKRPIMKSVLALDVHSDASLEQEELEKLRVEDFQAWFNNTYDVDDRAFVRLSALAFYVGFEASFWDTYRGMDFESPCRKTVEKALNAGSNAGEVRARLWTPEG